MADVAKMKNFEEQLCKQDARIEGILESIATDRQELEEKLTTNYGEMKALLENSSSEMKAFMAIINCQFNAYMKKMQSNKGILGNSPPTGDRSSPHLTHGGSDIGHQK